MNVKKTILGLTAIYIGTIFLLNNFHIIDFNYWSLVYSWPVVIILIGIYFATKKLHEDTKNILLLSSTAIALIFITYQGFNNSSKRTLPFSIKLNFSSKEDFSLEENFSFEEKFSSKESFQMKNNQEKDNEASYQENNDIPTGNTKKM